MNKLDVVGLKKAFATSEVIRNVSFTVADGEFLSILGPSGCGKTTILRLLIGLEKADEGHIYKMGVDITQHPVYERKMGIVFQNYALFENMTVFKNVAYALQKQRSTRATATQTALDMLKMVGLSALADRYPNQLSGGQQQRVALARTLALQPDIVLFDEPMSALDVDTRLSLRAELKAIQKQLGTTMIYITHDQEEAFSMSDRIMVMNEGEVHQVATPHELLSHPATSFVKRFVLDNLQMKIDALLPYARQES